MLPRAIDPSFCIIAPTAYLNHYATQSHTHLVLAHLVDTDQQYANFYQQLGKIPGDHYIIMDNGAFELGESYHPDKLIDLGLKCSADAIVLPDYPNQEAIRTVQAANELAPIVKKAGFDTMFVPQSRIGQINDWIGAYVWGATEPTIDIIGMSILGIPNALPYIPRAYARVVMTQLLIERDQFNFHKYHHYLGLNAGPALEIPPLIKMNALDSCDSSGPVWSAILGHEYTQNSDSYLPTVKPSKHVDFGYQWTKDQNTHDRIQHNLDLTLELFK